MDGSFRDRSNRRDGADWTDRVDGIHGLDGSFGSDRRWRNGPDGLDWAFGYWPHGSDRVYGSARPNWLDRLEHWHQRSDRPDWMDRCDWFGRG